MSEYDVNITRMSKKGTSGNILSEIWAEITNTDNFETYKKRIFWQGDDGIHHDETPSLPVDFRDAVDNAWIEKRRKL